MIDWWKNMKRCGGRDWGSAPKGDFAFQFTLQAVFGAIDFWRKYNIDTEQGNS